MTEQPPGTPEHGSLPSDPSGHLTADRLAAAALAAPDDLAASLDPTEHDHVGTCAVCRYELDALRRIAELSGGGGRTLEGMLEPEPALWARISAAVAEPVGLAPAAQVGLRGVGDPTHGSGSPASPDEPARGPRLTAVPAGAPGVAPRHARRRRSRAAIALVAAAVGLVVGVGGTVVARRVVNPPAVVVASTPLRALPGESGSGQAELVRSGIDLDLRVEVRAGSIPDRFYQLWLLDPDNGKMYDLGALPPTGSASYPLPAELAQGLGSYTTVDVSIEPYDGNPAHSHHSLVRGQLPS